MERILIISLVLQIAALPLNAEAFRLNTPLSKNAKTVSVLQNGTDLPAGKSHKIEKDFSPSNYHKEISVETDAEGVAVAVYDADGKLVEEQITKEDSDGWDGTVYLAYFYLKVNKRQQYSIVITNKSNKTRKYWIAFKG